MDKRFWMKIGTMGLGLALFIGGFFKDYLDAKEQEEHIKELVEEKINERLGTDEEETEENEEEA